MYFLAKITSSPAAFTICFIAVSAAIAVPLALLLDNHMQRCHQERACTIDAVGACNWAGACGVHCAEGYAGVDSDLPAVGAKRKIIVTNEECR